MPENGIEVVKLSDVEYPAPATHGQRWGNWMLNMKPPYPTLDYVGDFYSDEYPYQVCMESVTVNDEDFLHTLWHLEAKTWERGFIEDFVKAVTYLRQYGC